MSLFKQWSVNCDLSLPRCIGWIGQEDTGREARDLAKQAGWMTVEVDGRNQDACPRCYKAAFEARAAGRL